MCAVVVVMRVVRLNELVVGFDGGEWRDGALVGVVGAGRRWRREWCVKPVNIVLE